MTSSCHGTTYNATGSILGFIHKSVTASSMKPCDFSCRPDFDSENTVRSPISAFYGNWACGGMCDVVTWYGHSISRWRWSKTCFYGISIVCSQSICEMSPMFWFLSITTTQVLVATMMTSTNENIFRVTGLLYGEFTGPWWIPSTKASDAELWCFFLSAPEPTVEQTMETLVIWNDAALIMTSL